MRWKPCSAMAQLAELRSASDVYAVAILGAAAAKTTFLKYVRYMDELPMSNVQ